jgi:hypothetical protein
MCSNASIARALFSIGVATLLACVATSTARAQRVVLGADSEAAIPFDAALFDPGFSVALRGSAWLDRDIEHWGIELLGAYTNFGATAPDDDSTSYWRGAVGARVELGDRFRPGLFAHVGYGSMHHTIVINGGDVRGTGESQFDGLFVDLGASFDVQVFDRLFVGAHAAFNHQYAEEGSGVSFMTAGLQLGIRVFP